MTRIAIIGGGNIGEALIAGLVADGIDPKNIIVANRSEDRLTELADRYGVLTAED